MRRVLLGGYAAGKSTVFKNVRGSLKGYAKARDFIYAHPEMEPLQFAICSNWGSLLTPFCEDTYRGVVLSLYGGTAKGKTTACLNALHAFGDPSGMSLKSDRGFTENALWATMGAMNNIPLLIDEMTNVPAETMSRIAYTVSQGEERSRLINSPSGTKFAKAATWAMSPTVTSNTDLHTLLATNTANGAVYTPRLNHSRDPKLIGINLNHFIQVAAEKKQQIPMLEDLKRHLKTSRRRKFIAIKTINSQIREHYNSMLGITEDHKKISTSIKCWIFENPQKGDRNDD